MFHLLSYFFTKRLAFICRRADLGTTFSICFYDFSCFAPIYWLFSTDYQYLSYNMRDIDFKKTKEKGTILRLSLFLVTGTYLSAGEYINSWLPNLNYVWKNSKNEFNN